MTTRAERLRTALAAGLPAPRVREGCFSVEEYLAGDWAARRLDALARKIEVSRRLRAFYSADLALAAGEDLVRPEYVPLACACFLHGAESLRDYKYLNTALKMIDGILLEPAFAAHRSLIAVADELLATPLADAHR